MDEVDGSVSVEESSVGSRKRKRQGTERDLQKKKRYSQPRRALVFNPCSHNTKRFSCIKFRPKHLKSFNDHFYKNPNKTRQDNIVANFIVTKSVKRRRPRPVVLSKKQKPGGEHAFTVGYFLPAEHNLRIPVCKKFFLDITRVGRTRLANITRKVHSGQAVEERRGGDRKSCRSLEKKENVRGFIRKLRGTESHYNRSKSKRIYLSSELSIRKLATIYNQQASEELQVKCSMFRKIFVNEFNIGFKSPSSDTCSTCCLLKEKIKNAASGSQEKMQLMVEKRVHSQRAKAFYTHMKENVPNSISYCFDLQQIQPLPKCPIQEAYYARQINFYNLCITDLATKNPVFYTWTEEQAGKGSLEVSSALLSHLKNKDFHGNNILRLFCDGCISQNKNNIVLRTLVHFLQTSETSISKIILFFPVRGHSFLPADRVFGRTEKILRRKAVLVSKDEYYECYNSVGKIKTIGIDWDLLDTKSLNTYYKDLANISDLKRIVIKVKEDGDVLESEKKVTKKNNTGRPIRKRSNTDEKSVIVRGLQNYRFDSENEKYISLRKKGNVNLNNVQLQKVPLCHPITSDKKKDVDKLLKKLFGDSWASENIDNRLDWYKTVLFDTPSAENNVEEEICDCLENERCELHI